MDFHRKIWTKVKSLQSGRQCTYKRSLHVCNWKCGICCHIIALWVYLNHFNEPKVERLTLTGTQTWHNRGNLSPRKATSTSHISLKNFRNMRSSPRVLGGKRKTKKNDVSVPANDDDLKSDWLERDVNEVENVIKNGIDGHRIYTTISSRH